jgi:hypothetical protein
VGSATLTNIIATAVSQTAPTTNQNSSLKLGVRNFTNRDSNVYMYFTRPFPLKAQILSAKIIWYTTAEPGSGSRGFSWNRLAVGFSDSKVVYNTRPTTFIAGTKTVTKTLPWVDKTYWELDITDWMQTVSLGGPWFGFRIIPNTFEDNVLWMYSEIYTDTALRPRVEITWSDSPNQPGGLSPAGGRAVGLAKPVVKASFVDVSGSTALQAVRAQFNPTDAWTAPAFDSGWVPTSVPELDTSRTDMPGGVWAGLADGAATFWRIQFKDAAGMESPWSSSTSFMRDDKGVLTVNNPPSGTPKVEDATPPIAWTFTGETQSAYQIQIYHVVNSVRVIDWDTGKITGTGTSFTVPAGAINEPTNTTYTVVVRIWDAKAREATPGDPTYVEVTRDFTFIPGATTGSTSMVAVPDVTGRPKVVLTWTMGTFPDRLNVLRNGHVIAAGIDPNDTFVSGTTHTWTDRSPSPRRGLVYQVQRVVNDVASASNALSASVTVNSIGIWLVEPVSGIEVLILGREDRPFSFNSKDTVLQSIAPNSVPVAINQSLGGLEGTITGTLATYGGLTAQQWRDNYILLRNMRVKVFNLTTGDYTMRVVCQDFTYEQRTIPEPVFVVSFKFYQQDSVNSILLGS